MHRLSSLQLRLSRSAVRRQLSQPVYQGGKGLGDLYRSGTMIEQHVIPGRTPADAELRFLRPGRLDFEKIGIRIPGAPYGHPFRVPDHRLGHAFEFVDILLGQKIGFLQSPGCPRASLRRPNHWSARTLWRLDYPGNPLKEAGFRRKRVTRNRWFQARLCHTG